MSALPPEYDGSFIGPTPQWPRTVGAAIFSGRRISTVRITLPLIVDGQEFPFETLVFDRHGVVIDGTNYRTHDEAHVGHLEFLELYLQSQ